MPQRRGMLIKNVGDGALEIRLAGRHLHLAPGEERLVTAAEVRDSTLREHLQVRTIAIVRPSTDDEAVALATELGLEA